LPEHKVRKVLYFEKPGPENTDSVVRVVKERVKEGDIQYVVVASISGTTALRFAEELKDTRVSVVCVSGYAGWLTQHGIDYPFVRGEVRKKLEGLKVTIVDRTPSAFSGDTIDYGLARYGYIPPSWVASETLQALGGYGLKTAVEVLLMATDCSVVPPLMDVIAVAGTDKGADTAIVARSTFSTWMFSSDSAKRFQVLEILAMPRKKKWYRSIGVGGLSFQEVEKGEVLGEGAQPS